MVNRDCCAGPVLVRLAAGRREPGAIVAPVKAVGANGSKLFPGGKDGKGNVILPVMTHTSRGSGALD